MEAIIALMFILNVACIAINLAKIIFAFQNGERDKMAEWLFAICCGMLIFTLATISKY